MITLNAWAKREGISYSYAQKLLADDKIAGVERSATGKRILVPETTKAPTRESVLCAVCGRSFPQITGTHLRQHGITWDEYTQQYPDAMMVSSEILTTIIETHLGKPKTDEHRRKVSLGKMGGIPWNKGLVGSDSKR